MDKKQRAKNMEIYNAVRKCPEDAKRPIKGGKLKGKTDINPMFRIKCLTEQFGPCGIGWKTQNECYWTTPGANGEVVAWCSLDLVYRDEDTSDWSHPVSGIGGSMLVANQKGTLSTNDDAFKMARTDAISVACKSLGVAADVYWAEDVTKYGLEPEDPPEPSEAPVCEKCLKPVGGIQKDGKVVRTADDVVAWSKAEFDGHVFCWNCAKGMRPNENAG